MKQDESGFHLVSVKWSHTGHLAAPMDTQLMIRRIKHKSKDKYVQKFPKSKKTSVLKTYLNCEPFQGSDAAPDKNCLASTFLVRPQTTFEINNQFKRG